MYVDIIENNILSGSETFQGDITMNNNRIRNLHTPTSNNDAVIILGIIPASGLILKTYCEMKDFKS